MMNNYTSIEKKIERIHGSTKKGKPTKERRLPKSLHSSKL